MSGARARKRDALHPGPGAGRHRPRPARWRGEFPRYADCSALVTWILWQGLGHFRVPDVVNGANWHAGNITRCCRTGVRSGAASRVEARRPRVLPLRRSPPRGALHRRRQGGQLRDARGPAKLTIDYRADLHSIRRYISPPHVDPMRCVVSPGRRAGRLHHAHAAGYGGSAGRRGRTRRRSRVCGGAGLAAFGGARDGLPAAPVAVAPGEPTSAGEATVWVLGGDAVWEVTIARSGTGT